MMRARQVACITVALACCPLDVKVAYADQGSLIHPVTQQTIIFVPKLIHPWYEAVKSGANFAIQELKKQGIAVKVIWDEPPQADVSDQNQRIENDISRNCSPVSR